MKKNLLLFLLSCSVSNAQVFSENFNGNTLPSGWTVSNANTSFNWGVGSQNSFANFSSGNAFFDDNNAGSGSINPDARLISPIISLSGVTNPKLSFKYANMIYNLNSTMKVEAFNGTSWVQIFTTSGTSGTWGIDFNTFKYIINAYSLASNIDLTPYVNANFRLRFIYNDVGDYSYGFVMDDIIITSGNVLATSDVLLKDQFEVYPNPVKDNFYIKSDIKSGTKISVTDMSGKLLKTFTGKAESYNISDLPKGTYMILIENNKERIRKKIIKQ